MITYKFFLMFQVGMETENGIQLSCIFLNSCTMWQKDQKLPYSQLFPQSIPQKKKKKSNNIAISKELEVIVFRLMVECSLSLQNPAELHRSETRQLLIILCSQGHIFYMDDLAQNTKTSLCIKTLTALPFLSNSPSSEGDILITPNGIQDTLPPDPSVPLQCHILTPTHPPITTDVSDYSCGS